MAKIQLNFIHAGSAALFESGDGFDCGVCLWSACDAQMRHNTIAATGEMFSSIEWRFDATSAIIANNLTTHVMRERDGATATVIVITSLESILI